VLILARTPQHQFGAGEKELQGCIKVLLNNLCLDVDIEPWSDFFDVRAALARASMPVARAHTLSCAPQNVTISITVDRITVYQFNTTIPST